MGLRGTGVEQRQRAVRYSFHLNSSEGANFMNLSLLPGELHLNKTTDGDYVIKIQGEEVFNCS